MAIDQFALDVPNHLVALREKRNGYIMISTKANIPNFGSMPDTVLVAARDWSSRLEKIGAPRVYWILLSEVTLHLHMHVYPRWESDTTKGIPLFEERHSDSQPKWTAEVEAELKRWAEVHDVHIGQA